MSLIEEASSDHIPIDHNSMCHAEQPTAAATKKLDASNTTRNRTRRERIIVVTDSNGDDLVAEQLKPGAEVRKKTRYTFKQAMDFIPQVTKPEEINDVVFQVGFNDFRHGTKKKEVLEKHFLMQVKYKKLFPNARQHVTAFPPLSHDHNQMNKGLQKLCQNLGCNFISTKTFQDHATGRLRANLMRGFHYNSIGIRHLAKEIKKSLFSSANLQSTQLSCIVELGEENPKLPQ